MGDIRDPSFYSGFSSGGPGDRGFGPPQQQEIPRGCVGGPDQVNRFRRLAAPNLRNASIDKMDSCNEVSIGLLATLAITAAISIIALPFFDIAGMSWITTWEGSFMMSMGRLKQSLDEMDVREKALEMSFLVQHLDYRALTGDETLRNTFEDTLKARYADKVGNGASADHVELRMIPHSPDPLPSTSFAQQPALQVKRLLAALPDPQQAAQQVAQQTAQQGQATGPAIIVDLSANVSSGTNLTKLEVELAKPEAMTELCESMEKALAQHSGLEDLAQSAGGEHIKIVSRTLPTSRIDSSPAFRAMDTDEDGFVRWKEFWGYVGSENFSEPLGHAQAVHAFQGLDENANDVLEALEFDDAMSQEAFYQQSDKSFTTVITTTTQLRTTTTRPSTTTAPTSPPNPALRTTTLASRATLATTTLATTSLTATFSTTTTTEVRVVSIRLALDSLQWQPLSKEDRGRLAQSFQEDIAFAAGLLPPQIMDVKGLEDCVSMGAGPAGEMVAQGCLTIPIGATVADLQAVVTSSSMKKKILDDFGQVAGPSAIDGAHVRVEVTAQGSCQATPDTPVGAGTFCKGEMPAGAQPPTTAAAVSSTDRGAARITTSASPPRRPEPETTAGPPFLTMSEFLDRMGSKAGWSPRDAFAVLDTNNNDFADLLEFESATKNFHPPLSLQQSKNKFDNLDLNHDGRIESVEFYEAFKHAATTRPPGASVEDLLTLSQYRQSLGHQARYRKVGVGLCRTKANSWPEFVRYPEAQSKAACLSLCDTTPMAGKQKCGAFAFKLGGVCKLYPDRELYVDTTPMTDVECFTRSYGGEANFDMARAHFRFMGGDSMRSSGREADVGDRLAEKLAFEVGSEVTCSFRAAPELPHLSEREDMPQVPEAVCDAGLANGRRIEDLSAVISADSTKARIAQGLSSLPGMPQISASQIKTIVTGSSAKFRSADEDKNDELTLAEFKKAARKLQPPIDEDVAGKVFDGLDGDADGVLTVSEFEADGLREYRAS